MTSLALILLLGSLLDAGEAFDNTTDHCHAHHTLGHVQRHLCGMCDHVPRWILSDNAFFDPGSTLWLAVVAACSFVIVNRLFREVAEVYEFKHRAWLGVLATFRFFPRPARVFIERYIRESLHDDEMPNILVMDDHDDSSRSERNSQTVKKLTNMK